MIVVLVDYYYYCTNNLNFKLTRDSELNVQIQVASESDSPASAGGVYYCDCQPECNFNFEVQLSS
jgi:hypothetical protein